jgi:hypothetical protein
VKKAVSNSADIQACLKASPSLGASQEALDFIHKKMPVTEWPALLLA